MDRKSLPDKLAEFLPRGGIASLTEGIEFMSLWRWARLSLLVGAVVGLAAAGVFAVLQWGESRSATSAPSSPSRASSSMLSQQQIFAAYNAEILRRRLGADGKMSKETTGAGAERS